MMSTFHNRQRYPTPHSQMVIQMSNEMATALLLRPRPTGKLTIFLTPTHILHLKHWRSGLRTCAVSSQDYLVSSLSLPPDSEEALQIIRKSRPFSIRSTEKADSVISLFKDYLFDQTHMVRIFSYCPELLTFDPEKVLRPKLDYLSGGGITAASLIGIITTNPYILKRSLHKAIVPCVQMLQTLFKDDPRVLASFLMNRRVSIIFRYFSETCTPANVDALRRHGVPEALILRLLLFPGLMAHDPEHFSCVVTEVKNMGFDTQSINFIYGFRVKVGMSHEKWTKKLELLKKCFGWTDDQQVLDLFLKRPSVFSLSEDKLRQGFEMLKYRMGWTPDDIAKCIRLLGFSLEGRIFPRLCVLEILLSNGLINTTIIGSAYVIPEDGFLDRYVLRYQKDLPQLLEIYNKSKGSKTED